MAAANDLDLTFLGPYAMMLCMGRGYVNLLRSNRWRAFADGIKKERGYRCDYCGAVDRRVQAHHGFYRHGLKPWEYPKRSIWLACPESCHPRLDAARIAGVDMLGRVHPKDLGEVITYITHVSSRRSQPTAQSRH